MGIVSRVTSFIFKEQLYQLEEQIKRSIGSDFYTAMMRNVQNQPVYMPDNVENYIKDGYLFNPTVYAIVSYITQKAGVIPWGVYEVKNEKALNLYKSASPDIERYKRDAVKTKALIQIDSHPLNALFKNPNDLQSWSEFVEQITGFKLITGNAYIHTIGPKNGANAGIIKEMWTLPSQIVTIVAGDKTEPIKQYELRGDRTIVIPKEEVIHLKYWTPQYQQGQFLYGVSPIQAGRRVVTKSNSSYDSSVASFQNMGAYGMITGDNKTDGAGLTPEQAEMIEQRLARKTGPRNAGKPLVTSADIKWQQIGMSPVDLNIIESDKMDLRTLCNVYHVPSELFNDASNKTYSNTKEAGSAVYTNAVIPALTQLRDSINKFIKGNIFVDFDVSMVSELQDDLAMMTTALSGAWWITGNERRDIMSFGMDEKNPLMDEYLVPAGLYPLSSYSEPDIDDIMLDEAEKSLGINDYGHNE